MTTPKQTKTKHLPKLWLAIAILLTGCTPVPPMFKANYTTDYQPDQHLPQRPDVVARLLGDTLVVSACVYTKTLKPDSSVAGGPAWRFNIEFNLIDKNFKPLTQSNTQIDQTTTLTTPWIPDTLWLHFKFKPRISSQLPVLLTIKLTDAVTNTTLENWTPLLPSNYPLLQTPGLIPITFCVKSGTPISAHRLQTDIATHYTPSIPSPPFTSENRPPAPVHAWTRMPPAKQNPLKTPAPGLMRLTDSTSHQETVILVASKNFPAATTPHEGLLAIRYITTREEFRQLTTTSNLLQQILTVWDQPDQPDQAAKRARQYLDKIEEANRFFTRSQPGSLTDRGMIWIVYGVPGTVWKSPGIETWIYHETENGLPLRFDFDLTPIPTGQEWILRRSDLFRPSWNKAVNQWRQQKWQRLPKVLPLQPNYKIMKDNSLIYGIRAVMEAIEAGREFEKVMVQKGLTGDLYRELMQKLRATGTPLQMVPPETLHRLTNGNHQGVAAFVSAITYQPIEQIIPMLFEQGRNPFILILDRVTDVRNFGAIARTAECAGVDAILIPDHNSARITADAVKTSAGALHSIPVCRATNLFQTVKFLKNSGITIFAATEKGNIHYHSMAFDQPLALIMGSEENGVSADLLKISDHLVRIPLLGTIGSLNVSVAAGVLMYEVIRQRNYKEIKDLQHKKPTLKLIFIVYKKIQQRATQV